LSKKAQNTHSAQPDVFLTGLNRISPLVRNNGRPAFISANQFQGQWHTSQSAAVQGVRNIVITN